MPQATPDEIIVEMKCAHCFSDIENPEDPEREHYLFCSDACRMKGRLFPDAKRMHMKKKNDAWRKRNADKVRAYSLKSYHKNYKPTGRLVGRPRKNLSTG